MQNREFYTYLHSKPNGRVFYIGKGKGFRAHCKQHRNQHWQNIVNKYGSYNVEILAYWDTDQEAYEHEKLLISCFKDLGYTLSNVSDGGVGVMSGKTHSEETKLKISKALKGKPKSTEHVNKARNSNTGKKRSDEFKAKLSAAHKGKKHSPEHIKKRIAARLATMAARQQIKEE